MLLFSYYFFFSKFASIVGHSAPRNRPLVGSRPLITVIIDSFSPEEEEEVAGAASAAAGGGGGGGGGGCVGRRCPFLFCFFRVHRAT